MLWPLRRFFDPRFAGLEQVVAAKHEDLATRIDQLNQRLELVSANVEHFTDQMDAFRSLLAATIDTTNESSIVIGRTLSELLNAADETREAIEQAGGKLGAVPVNTKTGGRAAGRREA